MNSFEWRTVLEASQVTASMVLFVWPLSGVSLAFSTLLRCVTFSFRATAYTESAIAFCRMDSTTKRPSFHSISHFHLKFAIISSTCRTGWLTKKRIGINRGVLFLKEPILCFHLASAPCTCAIEQAAFIIMKVSIETLADASVENLKRRYT